MHDSLENTIETIQNIPNRYLLVPALALVVMSVLGMIFSGSSTWAFLALPGGSEAVSSAFVDVSDGPDGVNVTLKREVPSKLEIVAKNTNGGTKSLSKKGETVVVPAEDGDTIVVVVNRGETNKTILAHPYDAPEVIAPEYSAGDILWGAGYVEEVGNTSPVASGDTVVGGVGLQIRAYNASTGDEKWAWKPSKGTTTSPEVASDKVFVATNSKNASVYALELETGNVKWEVETTSGFSGSAPEYHAGVLYATSSNGVTYAIDAEEGDVLWNSTDTSVSSVRTSPTVTETHVFTGVGREAIAYTLQGDSVWKTTVSEKLVGKATAHEEFVVYHSDSTLYALDSETGDALWTHESGSSYTTPTATSERVFVRAGTQVLAINSETGESVWSHSLKSGKSSSSDAGVTFADGVLYVPSSKGIVALNASSGEENWRADRGPVFATPTVWKGVLYSSVTTPPGETMIALNTSHTGNSSGSVCGGASGNAQC